MKNYAYSTCRCTVVRYLFDYKPSDFSINLNNLIKSKIFARERVLAYSRDFLGENFFKDSEDNKSVTKKQVLVGSLLFMFVVASKGPVLGCFASKIFYYSYIIRDKG